jgi:RimJ/RimL family protein N-acetyltransferase
LSLTPTAVKVIGSSRFHGFDKSKNEIEIGWSFLARSHWGGIYNKEMKHLMLRHAFKFVSNVIFVVGPHNLRSQKAMEKIGAARVGSRPDPNGQISLGIPDYCGQMARRLMAARVSLTSP